MHRILSIALLLVLLAGALPAQAAESSDSGSSGGLSVFAQLHQFVSSLFSVLAPEAQSGPEVIDVGGASDTPEAQSGPEAIPIGAGSQQNSPVPLPEVYSGPEVIGVG